MRKSALKDIANWRTKKKTESCCTKSQPLAWMITISRRRNWKRLENDQKYALQIVLKCLYSARIGRPDILWSVNWHEQSQNGQETCDRRLARLMSDIHHTNDYRQLCHVGNTPQQCR